MKRLFQIAALIASFWSLPGLAWGQVDSGPQAGSAVKPVKAVALIKDEEAKEKNLVAERGNKPTIYLFVQAATFDRPIARFLRTLDKELSSQERDDVKVVAVWLTDDVDKSKEYVPRARESLKLGQTLYAVFPGEKSGPEGWGINEDAHLTAVVVEKGKVSGSFGYRSVNETDVPAVMKKLSPKK
jgi:hypothetical protein